MRFPSTDALSRLLRLTAGLLVLKVTLSIVLQYGDYFPPDFESGFLQGRESYFSGIYRWAFYPHIFAGPLTLVLGTLLVSDRFRRRWPGWHRRLGRIQAPMILGVVAPTGLWMATRAEAGPAAGISFVLLAVWTGTTVVLGWRAAVRRQFVVHRRWMWRCYLALCSTVVLRLTIGASTVTGVEVPGLGVIAAWGGWLAPLVWFETAAMMRSRTWISPRQLPAAAPPQ